jgi:hypothetical protein
VLILHSLNIHINAGVISQIPQKKMAISSKTHGIIDLVVGAAFIAAPFILNALDDRAGSRQRSNASKALLPSLGAGILAETMMTRYEFGAVKALPMRSHLRLDYGLAAFMMAAPWLLNMDNRVKIPLTIVGAASLGIALFTEQEPELGLNEFDDAFDEAVDAAALIA